MSSDNELIAEGKWEESKVNIYVRCNAVGCTYINGPFHSADDAIIAAHLHEIAYMDKRQQNRHKTYFQDLHRTADIKTAAQYWCAECCELVPKIHNCPAKD